MRNYLLKAAYLIAVLGVSGTSWAVEFRVNDFGDMGDASSDDGVCATAAQTCTLRAAVQQARKMSGTRIVLPDGRYELGSGREIVISSNLRIEGGGADKVVVSGKKLSRVFLITGGAFVTISGISVTEGRAIDGGGIAVFGSSKLALVNSTVSNNTSEKNGAGIYISLGAVSIDDTTISDNIADGAGGAVYIIGNNSWLTIYQSSLEKNASGKGGAIYCRSAVGIHLEKTVVGGNISRGKNALDGGGAIYNSQCSISLSQAEFDNNSAERRGGALFNASKGTFTIGRSTFSSNRAIQGDGGAIYSDGSLDMQRVYLSGNSGVFGSALYDAGRSNLVMVTVADNRTDNSGGAIYHNSSGEMILKYSTIAKNDGGNIINEAGVLQVGSSLVADAVNGSDCAGSITSSGYNLDSDGTCALSGGGDRSSENPLLVAVQNSKGYEPGSGSPAINSGSPDCPALDQRFHTRPGQCDIGAFEAGGAAVQAGTISFKKPVDMVREDAGVATITLTRSMGSEGAVSVRYQDSPMSTARSGFDFADFDGVLEWEDGEIGDKSFQIDVFLDSAVGERIESLSMYLSNPTGGAIIGDNRTAILNIVDAAARFGELGFESASYDVLENAVNLSVTVKRSNGNVGEVSVRYTTEDKEATAGQDYTAVSDVLVFADGETTKTISIPIIDNREKDRNKMFTVRLSDITGGATAGVFDSTTVTILDDESGGGASSSGNANGTSGANRSGGGGGSPGVVLLLMLAGLGFVRFVKRIGNYSA